MEPLYPIWKTHRKKKLELKKSPVNLGQFQAVSYNVSSVPKVEMKRGRKNLKK